MRFSALVFAGYVLSIAGCPTSSDSDSGTGDVPSMTDAPRADAGGRDGGAVDGGGGGMDGGDRTDGGGADGGTGDGGNADGGGGPSDGGGGPGDGGMASTDGGNADGGGGPSDGGGTDGGSTGLPTGDCNSSADCPRGGTCVELSPGGYRVCQVPPVEATGCDPSRPDECCDSTDCGRGEQCFLGPIRRFCGGAFPIDRNVCMSDQCRSDRDCTGSDICAPAGTFAPVAICITGSCHGDGECTAEPGGRCVVVTEPCCDIRVGLFCAYPDGGCRSSADCAVGFCGIGTDRAECMTRGPFCPG